jgi:hypothetical protein
VVVISAMNFLLNHGMHFWTVLDEKLEQWLCLQSAPETPAARQDYFELRNEALSVHLQVFDHIHASLAGYVSVGSGSDEEDLAIYREVELERTHEVNSKCRKDGKMILLLQTAGTLREIGAVKSSLLALQGHECVVLTPYFEGNHEDSCLEQTLWKGTLAERA